jgi:hypothetical protein
MLRKFLSPFYPISLSSIDIRSSLLKHSMAAVSGPLTTRHPSPFQKAQKFLSPFYRPAC